MGLALRLRRCQRRVAMFNEPPEPTRRRLALTCELTLGGRARRELHGSLGKLGDRSVVERYKVSVPCSTRTTEHCAARSSYGDDWTDGLGSDGGSGLGLAHLRTPWGGSRTGLVRCKYA